MAVRRCCDFRYIWIVELLALLLLLVQGAQAQRLEKIGQCKTGTSICQAVFVQGNYAYICERYDLLAIVNITNPISPWVEGSLINYVSPISCYVLDTVAFVNSGSSMQCVSVANPASPYWLGTLNFPGSGTYDYYGTYVRGNTAYLCGSDRGIYLADVSSPRSPALLDSFKTSGTPIDLDMKDTLLFVTGFNPNAYYDSLLILNAANPHLIREIGSCSVFPWVMDVVVSGNYAYTANWTMGGSRAPNLGVMNVVDITNPANPTVVARIDSLVGAANAVCWDSNYVYVAMRNYQAVDSTFVPGGVRVVDAHDPAQPKVVAGYDLWYPHDGFDVKARFPYVYVAGRDSFFVFQFTPSGVEGSPPSASRLTPYNVSPNPFTSFAILLGHEKESFVLYDVSGRKVGVFKGDHIGEGLSAGIYFLKSEGEGAKPLRIVKLR